MSGESNSSYPREEVGLGVESTEWCQHLRGRGRRARDAQRQPASSPSPYLKKRVHI